MFIAAMVFLLAAGLGLVMLWGAKQYFQRTIHEKGRMAIWRCFGGTVNSIVGILLLALGGWYLLVFGARFHGGETVDVTIASVEHRSYTSERLEREGDDGFGGGRNVVRKTTYHATVVKCQEFPDQKFKVLQETPWKEGERLKLTLYKVGNFIVDYELRK